MKDVDLSTGYEPFAQRYADVVDTKPHNAYYERPATLAMLPDLQGKRILDAGCGSGWYAEYYAEHGASVTSVDASETMVRLTKNRLGDRVNAFCADLNKPLDSLTDNSFDLVVSPLTMHYLEKWEPVFAEFRRLLILGGTLLFSTHHPFTDIELSDKGDYFLQELLEDDWGLGHPIHYYRRPLSAMTEALASAGFLIERIVEPQPSEEFRRIAPEAYKRMVGRPWFLIIRAQSGKE